MKLKLVKFISILTNYFTTNVVKILTWYFVICYLVLLLVLAMIVMKGIILNEWTFSDIFEW